MSLVNLVIDGKKVAIGKDKTLLDVAKKAGIKIPTLCHHEKLLPYGACRLCMVEIVRGNRSRMVASCAYQVEEGLEVKTDSPKVLKIRKLMIELLQAIAPTMPGLRRLAEVHNVEGSRFNKKVSVCILCGLCARYCAEVKNKKPARSRLSGSGSVGFIGRGIERRLNWVPDSTYKEHCAGCFECFSICPTGVFPSNWNIDNIKQLKNKVG